VRQVLYRLPELGEALAHGRTVVLVEGEAKADLLWRWNIPATCSPMGAKNWRADLYAATLRGILKHIGGSESESSPHTRSANALADGIASQVALAG
jgi:hypothetical protein